MPTPRYHVWFWMVLFLECDQAHSPQERLSVTEPLSSPGVPDITQRPFFNTTVKENVHGIMNVKLNLRRKTVHWNFQGNVTWNECTIKTLESSSILPVQIQEDDSTQYYCWFLNTNLQHGAEITINVTSDGKEYTKTLKLDNPGNANTSARNLSCVIYNINFMNCSWLPGPAAPADVKYHLNVWTRLEDGDDITECPQYIYDQAGINVGCHFEQLSELQGTEFFFVLNGTSEETSIPFREFFPFALDDIEKYNPPVNITSHYNGSDCFIEWENPKRRSDAANHVLEYQLDIQKNGRSQKLITQKGQDRNLYLLPSSETHGHYSVRIRVRYIYSSLWSEWSNTLPFGQREETSMNATAVIISAVGAAVILTLVLMMLLTRYSLRQKLFPKIPQVKSLFTPNTEIPWEEVHSYGDIQEPEFIKVEEME